LTVEVAYAFLAEEEEESALVELRTQPERTCVGAPDRSELGETPVFQEGRVHPSRQVVADFVPRATAALDARGGDRSMSALPPCRSGAGWMRGFNVADGSEGDLDAQFRRGASGGWRVRGLPWTQS
jgi:hypothetical protein